MQHIDVLVLVRIGIANKDPNRVLVCHVVLALAQERLVVVRGVADVAQLGRPWHCIV